MTSKKNGHSATAAADAAPKIVASDTTGEAIAGSKIDALGEISAAVESGSGLPKAVRAAARVLDCAVAIVDPSQAILAVAAGSPAEEKILLTGGGSSTADLCVAHRTVGHLIYRPRGPGPSASLVRTVVTLIALEVERTAGPTRISHEAASAFFDDLLDGRLGGDERVVDRAKEFGLDLQAGVTVLVVRPHAHVPEVGDWRTRVLNLVERAVRGVVPALLAAVHGDEVIVIAVCGGPDKPRQAADAVLRSLEAGLSGFDAVVGLSRPDARTGELHRATGEAMLAANVAESRREKLLAFDESGAYRLLLPAMMDDPLEVERFYAETIAPLVAYDEQYETDLVTTLETFLGNDGHSEATARTLHTHRHTVRYRLERIRELSGLDVGSTEGREKLSLGLKAMRVMGIPLPSGPAFESSVNRGRMRREDG